jgi:hypothetical protein
VRSLGVAVALLLVLLSARTEAGRRRFGWSYDTETVPQRGVELETWVTEQTGALPWAALRWMTVFGLTDELELAIPVELVWRDPPGDVPARTAFETWGLEARWRLAPADPVEAGPFVTLLRLGVNRRVIDRKTVEVEGNVVFSLALECPRLYAVLDLGGRLTRAEDDTNLTGNVGAGLAFAVLEDLRLGAEAIVEHQALVDEGRTWVGAGPTLSLTHGRMWLVATLPVGLNDEAPNFLPRVLWAIAF